MSSLGQEQSAVVSEEIGKLVGRHSHRHRLVQISQSLGDDVGRLTDTMLSLQRTLNSDKEPFYILDIMRETRWSLAVIIREFEIMTHLEGTVADLVHSLRESGELEYNKFHSRTRLKVSYLEHLFPRQSRRLLHFRTLWRDVIGSKLRAPRAFLPPLGSSFEKAMAQSYAHRAKQRHPDSLEPQPLGFPDLTPFSPSILADTALLEKHYEELTRFWRRWVAPPGLGSGDRIIVNERDWLEKEWNISHDLGGLKATFHRQFTMMYEEPPALKYPIP